MLTECPEKETRWAMFRHKKHQRGLDLTGAKTFVAHILKNIHTKGTRKRAN